MVATERSNSLTVTGSYPIVRRAESPRPMPTTMRPPDTSCSVAVALAVTVGSRVPGLVTHRPSLMRSVASAAAVRNGYGSCHRRCESYIQPYPKPFCSARLISSTKRVKGGSGRTVTPKLSMSGGRRRLAQREVAVGGRIEEAALHEPPVARSREDAPVVVHHRS